MGKTIQIAALLHTSQPVIDDFTKTSNSATLVVAPTSLLSQWASELERASKPGSLKVKVWHGTNRISLDSELGGADVVITSYGVLASEHAKHQAPKSNYRSPLFKGKYVSIPC